MGKEKSNKVECCVLVADVNDSTYYYNIPKLKIEESMNVITVGFNKLNNPCSRVYIAGFTLISEDDVLTKERLIERLAYQTNASNKRKNSSK